MTISVAFYNCPHCVDSFAFDFEKLKSLTLHSRVSVRCPGCQNVIEVVTNACSVIPNTEFTEFSTQPISILYKGINYTVRTNDWTTKGTGPNMGSITNNNDVALSH
jgi:hypothetical protein